jgi:hypothetical protein
MSEQEVGVKVARPNRTTATAGQIEEGQRGGEVTDLIRLAMDKGVDVAVLERLVALKERVMDRDARGAFFQALANFQRECPVLDKNATAKITTKTGGSYSYTFTPLPDICKQVNPILERHGLSYSWTTKEAAHPKVLMVVCVLRHVDGHEERAEFPVPTETDAAMSGAQKVGAALTYGRRQSLVSVLGIVTADEDDDAPDRVSAARITEQEVEQLNRKIDEVTTGRDDQDFFRRFLKFMNVDGLGAIPASDFGKAMTRLEQMKPAVRE